MSSSNLPVTLTFLFESILSLGFCSLLSFSDELSFESSSEFELLSSRSLESWFSFDSSSLFWSFTDSSSKDWVLSYLVSFDESSAETLLINSVLLSAKAATGLNWVVIIAAAKMHDIFPLFIISP